MKRSLLLSSLLAFALGGLSCRHTSIKPAAALTEQQQIDVNCLSLLHQLLEEEKDVSKLLIIKRESPELNRLIKTISTASAAAAKKLAAFARQDSSISLDQINLPKGETATRKAIAVTQRNELLTSSGDDFEFTLLLTQASALEYAWHLAKVASARESQQERAHYLNSLSEEMKDLHHKVVSLLHVRTAPRKP